MVFCARCLDRNVQGTLAILADLLCAGDLSETGRIRDVIREKRNRLHASVIPSGHLFARRTAAASISVPAYREEQWYGRTQLQVLNGLADNFDDDLRQILDRMRRLRELVFKKSRLQVDLTADGKTLSALLESVPGLINRLGDGPGVVALPVPQRQTLNKGVSIPAKVCFVARVFPAPPYIDRLAPSLMVLSRELSNNHLYKRVRLQGGAYGGMSVYDAVAGYSAFLSYRDPNLEGTLKVYSDAIKIAAHGNFKEIDIEKAKIGTIGLTDRPMDPATKGYTAMVRRFAGITDKDRQAFRDAVFESSLASIKEAAERHLAGVVERSSTAVYASLERLRSANEKTEDAPLEIEPLTSPA
jgi:Zn-dependent M16 (insulinase) family peptidase